MYIDAPLLLRGYVVRTARTAHVAAMAAAASLAEADAEHDAEAARVAAAERAVAPSRRAHEQLLAATWRLFPPEPSGRFEPAHIRAVFGLPRLD